MNTFVSRFAHTTGCVWVAWKGLKGKVTRSCGQVSYGRWLYWCCCTAVSHRASSCRGWAIRLTLFSIFSFRSVTPL